MSHPNLLCLLVARDCGPHLPGYLESVSRFADGIVALEDDSSDDSRTFLEAHPFVRRVLPKTEGDEPSDDHRARLVIAAAGEGADWVMFLQASERIPADDADALRTFVDEQPDPESVYLFRRFRMVGDLAHYDHARAGIPRMFAVQPGLGTQAAPLAPNGLPASIPPSRWRRTTIRIQDVGSMRQALGSAPLAANDARLGPRARVKPWWPRGAGFPVLANTPAPEDPAVVDAHDPVLSAIVISKDDEATIERSVRAAVEQECPESFEVILVTSGTDRTAQIVRERFPQVHVVELDHPALPGEARNAGLRVARGHYVSFPGSHVVLEAGYFAAAIRAHRQGNAMAVGPMLNGTLTVPGWAAYFLENGMGLPGRPSQQLDTTPGRCSFLRSALDEVGRFPEDMRSNEDTAVIIELFSRGYSAYYTRDMRFTHYGPCRRTPNLIRHFFARGRGLGRILLHEAELEGRVPNRRMLRYVIQDVPARLRMLHHQMRRWGSDLHGKYRLALPHIVIGATSWWLGGCYEFARRGPGARLRTRNRPRV